MVSAVTWERRELFRNENWSKLFIRTLFDYRKRGYLLHEFVLMPDHFHALLTPRITLERAVQFIKGGFSYRAKKVLGSNLEVWQRGFSDHRIRDYHDYEKHVRYIHENPVRKKLARVSSEYLFCSAYAGYKLAPVPRGLKPDLL
jgi:putative transposase